MCISIHAVCTMIFCPKEGVPWSPPVTFERSLWDSLGISGTGHAVPGPLGTFYCRRTGLRDNPDTGADHGKLFQGVLQ